MGRNIDIAREFTFIEDYLDELKGLESNPEIIKQLTTRFYNKTRGRAKLTSKFEFQKLLCNILQDASKDLDFFGMVETRQIIDTNKVLRDLELNYDLFFKDIDVEVEKEETDKETNFKRDKLSANKTNTYSNLKQLENEKVIQKKFEYSLLKNENKNRIITHFPFNTTKILRNFKTDNETGFKDIVHQSVNEDDPKYLRQLIAKLKSHPIYIFRFTGEKVKDFQPIQNDVRNAISELIKDFIDLYDKSNQNPFGKDTTFTQKAQLFKRSYRFGWNSDEATDLRETILKIFKTQTHISDGNFYAFNGEDKFNLNQLCWTENENHFNIVANFFTWVPAVKIALRFIVQSILQHSNIAGKRSFKDTMKKIEIDLSWEDNFVYQGQKMVRRILTIKDVNSLPNISADRLLSDIKRTNLIEFQLKNVCNFSIHSDFNDGPKSVNFLETANPDGSVKKLNEPVGGFKYKIEFIDIA